MSLNTHKSSLDSYIYSETSHSQNSFHSSFIPSSLFLERSEHTFDISVVSLNTNSYVLPKLSFSDASHAQV